MPKWYDAAPPNVEEVAKKEFGNLIEDDPEWKVVGTIAKDDIIKSWAEEEEWKSVYNANTVQIGATVSSTWPLSAIAELNGKMWSDKVSKYWGWEVKAGDWKLPEDPLEYGLTPSGVLCKYVDHGALGMVPSHEDTSNGGLIPTDPVRPKPHQCHCLRDRHLEPLTQKVAVMLSQHSFDPNYDASQDDSPIICVGSETYGPNRPPQIHPRRAELIKNITTWVNPYLPEEITVSAKIGKGKEE